MDVPGTGFFQVDLRKIGTTGTSNDTVILSVDNVPLISMPDTLLAPFSPRGLEWGEGFFFATGTLLVTGVSFGIGRKRAVLGDPGAFRGV